MNTTHVQININTKIKTNDAREWGQQVKALATKPEGPSLGSPGSVLANYCSVA